MSEGRGWRARAIWSGRILVFSACVLVPPTLALGAVGADKPPGKAGPGVLAQAEGQRWDIPARIYSDTYAVYPSLRVDTDSFRRRIERLGYSRSGGSPSRRGSYSFSKGERSFAIWLHQFDYPTRREPGRLIKMQLDEAGRIISMRSDDREILEFELEPALLSVRVGGGFEERQVLDPDGPAAPAGGVQVATSGGIDRAAWELALSEPVPAAASEAVAVHAPHFIDYVTRELSRRFPARVMQSESYRIFTTLDTEMQAIAEHVVADNVVEMERDIGDALAKAGQPLQAAMVVMEPRTGKIRAMVGGRDYSGGGLNRAIDMRRQPGSTFKPIVALAALGSEQVGAKHFRTTSLVMDERMQWEWQGQVWSPRNYEGEFYGLVTVREAIEHSLNSAVARISKDIGVKPIRDLAVRLGMTPDLGVYPSIVLGGQQVPLLDMAKVFSVFASGGIRATPLSVDHVTDSQGQALAGAGVEIRRVVPATDAYLVTHILEGVMERGTGAVARRKGFKHPAAGKTGTSNDYKDAWFVGFTPSLLSAVWVGFDEPASMGLAGSEAALPIWTDFMRQALADTPHDSFEIPAGIVLADVDKKNGRVARPECPKQVREAFLRGEEPHETCQEHGGAWQ